jgi:sulfur-oxidizing protein SoxX
MWSTRSIALLSLSGMFMIALGCSPKPESGKGFTMPDGDVERGKTAFVELNCHHCHIVSGAGDLPPLEEREMSVRLGGEVARIGTYGELVTAIINPSHRLAKGHKMEDVSKDGHSLMKNYNEVLTVSQLIDLVALLQSHYSLRKYEPTDYPMYY